MLVIPISMIMLIPFAGYFYASYLDATHNEEESPYEKNHQDNTSR